MPQIHAHAPGSFSWVELATTDQARAKSFYSALLGWNSEDQPMGPSGTYTTFKLDGRPASGAYTLRPEERDSGVPPHWNLYVTVENADAAAGRARDLGAVICEEPFDVFDIGRMAVVRDPTGAYFAVWQGKRPEIGLGIRDEPGAFCWADLNTPDPAKAAAFYTQIFGWTMAPGESGYLHIRNGEQFIGGIPPGQQAGSNAPPHWLIYFQVADCAESASQAKELGANVLFGPIHMENVGHIGVLADPQGAVFALFQQK
jgi:uncharacterized protein